MNRRITFEDPTEQTEVEILEQFSKLTNEDHPDLLIHDVPSLLSNLHIQDCFQKELSKAFIANKTAIVEKYVLPHTDIIDIDKLISNISKYIKLRDNYNLILETWSLFFKIIQNRDCSEEELITFKMTLPDLKKVKEALNLTKMNDSGLIDMIGVSGKTQIALVDFGMILGLTGDLD